MAVNRDAGSLRGAGRLLASVAMAIVASVCLLSLRRVVRGSSDPFSAGWPVYLHATSLLATVVIGCWLRHPFAAAIGTYAGLLIVLFATGASEYPMSSVVALAVHGLIPALIGSLIAVGLLRVGRGG